VAIVDSIPMISARQIRTARAILGWSQQQLADKARVARSTISRMEIENSDSEFTAAMLELVRRAFEDAGVVLLSKDGCGGEGVRMRD